MRELREALLNSSLGRALLVLSLAFLISGLLMAVVSLVLWITTHPALR